MKSLFLSNALVSMTKALVDPVNPHELTHDSWDYKLHGSDWGALANAAACGKAGGSPIDLKSYGTANFKDTVAGDDLDKLTSTYKDVDNAVVTWNGHTSQVNIAPAEKVNNQFTSSLPKEIWSAGVTLEFRAQQFHFHAPSEHTVDGNQVDLEMHIVHYAEDKTNDHGFPDAAVSLLFSKDSSTAVLTDAQKTTLETFFNDLEWTTTLSNPTVSKVTFGKLMEVADLKNRWIYKGSVTTPPCEQTVYWNVLSTVYPISQTHLDQFKNQLKRNTNYLDPNNLSVVGNYRSVQDLGDRKVTYVRATSDRSCRSPAKGEKRPDCGTDECCAATRRTGASWTTQKEICMKSDATTYTYLGPTSSEQWDVSGCIEGAMKKGIAAAAMLLTTWSSMI